MPEKLLVYRLDACGIGDESARSIERAPKKLALPLVSHR